MGDVDFSSFKTNNPLAGGKAHLQPRKVERLVVVTTVERGHTEKLLKWAEELGEVRKEEARQYDQIQGEIAAAFPRPISSEHTIQMMEVAKISRQRASEGDALYALVEAILAGQA